MIKENRTFIQGGNTIDVSQLPTTMRAAVLHGPRTIRIDNVPVPHVAADEVLVAVDVVGLCGSDVHCYTGERAMEYPMILGHEITGRIVATGTQVQAQRVGERVVVEPNIPCGRCALCLRGLGRVCPEKQSIGLTRAGGLADYVAVPNRFAWPLAEQLMPADAATIEPTTVAVHALRHAQIESGATIAIVGCGGVGLLLATVAIAQGYRVVAIEPNETRRNAVLAAGAICAFAVSDAREAQLLFEQEGVIAIFECAGLSLTAQLCLDAAPQGCSIVLLGMSTDDIALNPLRFVRHELEIRGALIYEHPEDFASTIELVTSGRLTPGSTAGPPQPLEHLPALLETMAAGKLDAKPLIAVRPILRQASLRPFNIDATNDVRCRGGA